MGWPQACWLAAAIVAMLAASGSLPALAGDQVRVVNLASGQMLRLRAESHGNAEVLAYIPFDSSEVTLAGSCTDEWCNISFRGMTGWAFKKYLDIGNAKPGEAAAVPAAAVRYKVKGVATGQQLIIRDGPESDGDPLGIIPADASGIEDRGCRGGWCRVRYQNSVGWVEQRFLEKDGSPENAASPAVEAKKEPEKAAETETAGAPKRYAVEGIMADQPLTIRDSADIMASVVGLIPPDAKDIEGMKKCITKWCLIRYNGMTGWTLRRHLADMDIGKGKRFKVIDLDISDSLLVKDYPSDEADDVGTIPAFGSGIVQIGECGKDWCHVRFLGTVGWVNSQYIGAEGKN